MSNLRAGSKLSAGLGAVVVAIATLAPVTETSAAEDGPLIFAAASMKTALDAVAKAWVSKGHGAPKIAYGSSGVLAKQITAGAPADLFISADEKWMDALAKNGSVEPATRENLLGNALVLVQPESADVRLPIKTGFDLASALSDGKLAVCTVSSCPAGIYGKEALTKLGVWAAVEPKLAQAENVRAALLLVARGEAKLGIVYATDAKAEPKVKVVDTFPDDSHSPIVYPVAVTKAARSADARSFEAFLSGPEATKIFTDQGFNVLKK